MSKLQNFIVVLGCLLGGMGLVIISGITGNEGIMAPGTGLLGVAMGAVVLRRPQDL